MKLKYFYNLEGVRGIAAMMVVIYHIFFFSNLSYIHNLNAFQKVTEFGRHGVPLFFVLSGFVITRILINTRENKNYFRSFYKKRILRILPLYYLFLIIYYSIPNLLSVDGKGVEFVQQLPFYFYLQNLTEVLNISAAGPVHYWTLSVEEHFYILWPLAVYLVNPKNLGKLIVIIIILVLILRYIMLNAGLPIDKFTFTRIDQILLGAYLAVLEWSNFFNESKNKLKIGLTGILVFPVIICIYLFSDQFPLFSEIINQLILGLFFFSIIGCLVFLKKDNFINKVLTCNTLQFLGRISYGIYVWHILVILILNRFFNSRIFVIDFFLPIVLTILLAHLSYKYFEKIFLRMKDANEKKLI